MIAVLQNLFIRTLKAPNEAAGILIGLNLGRETLWMALALTCVVNALLVSLMGLIYPVPPEHALPLMNTPGTTLVAFSVISVMTVVILHWIGQKMGGQAAFNDILVLIAWIQAMRAVLQAVIIPMIAIMPFLSALLSFAVGIYGLWILANFLKVGHRFDKLSTAFALMGLSFMAGILGMVMIALIFGTLFGGLT